jgi:hypothetical protein
MPFATKGVFILVMWVGRLEIVPVLVVILELANRSVGDDTAQISEVRPRAGEGPAASPEGPSWSPGQDIPSEDAWKGEILAGTDVEPEVFDSVFAAAVEISREGREGKPVGTAFVVGDAPAVLERSRQLILNPFEGHDREHRLITNREIIENVKGFALLDGAFVISGKGVIEAAGRYLTMDTSGVRIPTGLGTRHGSVAGITRATMAIGIVVSQSGGRISVFRAGEMVKQFMTL